MVQGLTLQVRRQGQLCLLFFLLFVQLLLVSYCHSVEEALQMILVDKGVQLCPTIMVQRFVESFSCCCLVRSKIKI